MIRDDKKLLRVRDAMQRNGLAALVLRIPENVSYLSGVWCARGLSYLVFPASNDPVLIHHASETDAATWISDVRYYKAENFEHLGSTLEVGTDLVKKTLNDLGITSGTIGVEQGWEFTLGTPLRYELNVVGEKTLQRLREKLTGYNLKDASEVIVNCRSIKTELEITALRKANRIAMVGLDVFHRKLKAGITEMELSSEIEHEIVTDGVLRRKAARVVACAFVASGPQTAVAYKYAIGNTRRKLRRGDLVMLELDVIADGYSSDLTRTFVVGKPNRKQQRLFEAILDSEESSVASVQPEVSAAEVARTSIEVIQRHGLSGFLVHRLGHGIGVAVHEPIPALHIESKDILQAGMVHSVEPGIYGPKIGGIRIEDDIWVTKTGAEYLSNYTRMPE